MARSEKEALEVQVNRLQHKVKDLGEDFRMRLIKYIEDISVSERKVLNIIKLSCLFFLYFKGEKMHFDHSMSVIVVIC